MRSRLLTALVLLGGAGLARADYMVIIANLNAPPGDQRSLSGEGGPPGAGGFRGGMPGMGGMIGGPPGAGGAGGPGMGGMTGMRGGMGGPGMTGGPGARGGAPGGLMGEGGPGGLGSGTDVIDDAPFYVVAVLEVNPQNRPAMQLFKKGQQGLIFNHPSWGQALILHHAYFYEAIPLETNAGVMLPSAKTAFATRFDQMKGKGGTEEGLKLARWALEHGLVDEFAKVMDELAKTEKTDAAVNAYVKLKAELAKPVSGEDVAGRWKSEISLDSYKIHAPEGYHYALLHNSASDNFSEVKPQLDRLEKSFKSFYYWWTTKGINLPLPAKRQVAILTENTDAFRRLKRHLTSTPVLADSFFARREGLTVFGSKRGDDGYVTLEKVSKPEWDKGFNRQELLKKVSNRGTPKGTQVEQTHLARTYAMLLKALENEWEATGMSHEASRQLLYASKQLPPNVNAPEWLLFGVGSFFETPLQSPFGGAGAPNPYYLPRFKEYLEAKKYGPGPDHYEALEKVVTDAGFRAKPPQGEPAGLSQRQARSAAWALYYFLAHKEMPKLQQYYKELAKMPRDVELDEKVLLQAFARAFGCVNPDKTVNKNQLKDLAGRWVAFVKDQPLEVEAVHKKVREYYQQVVKAQTSGTGTGTGGPPRPGGAGGPAGGGPGGDR